MGPHFCSVLESLFALPLHICIILISDHFSTDKPTINTTKLPKVIPVFQGYPEELVCEADGQPAPKIQWFYNSDKVPHVSGNKLLVTEAGFYNCSATNEVDSTFHVVEVISKGKNSLLYTHPR